MVKSLPIPKPNFLERAAAHVAPGWAMKHWQARAGMQAFIGFKSGTGGFVVPGSRRRSMRGWEVMPNTVDEDVVPSLEGARAGSRDLWMNTPMATAALKRMRTNVVGYGLSLQCQVDTDMLGMSPEAADAWERNTEREWSLWVNSQDCDSRRQCNFYDLQALAFMSALMNGDVFVLLPWIKRPNLPYDLRVQLIEADFVSNPRAAIDTTTTAAGVEVDEWGAPIAYHIRSIPMGQSIFVGNGINAFLGTWERVPAFGRDSGRRNVLHLMQHDRPGQRRGMPFLTPVMETLKQLSRLSEAELTAAVITSFFTVFVKNSAGPASSLTDAFATADKVSGRDPSDASIYEMGPGNVIELDENQEIQQADPKRPNGAFAPFFEAILKQIGAALEIPYELLLAHFSSSYSASRGAILEAWKFFKTQRIWLARNFCQPIYEEWLAEAVIKGRIKAPGFFDDPAIRAAWAGTKWAGAGQGQLDPLKETQAAALRMDSALSTHEDEYTALWGEGWESGARRIGREKRIMEREGIDKTPSIPKVGQAPIGETPPPAQGEGK